MLRKFGMIAVLSLIIAAFAAVPVLAVTNFNSQTAPQGAHYRNNFGEPVCTFNATNNSVTCTGTQIGGVGNTNARAQLTLDITATVDCRNPGNRNVVEPHTYTDTVTASSPLLRPDRNGTLVVPSLTASAPSPADVDADFQCPNPRWQDEVRSVSITGYHYRLFFEGFNQPAISIDGTV